MFVCVAQPPQNIHEHFISKLYTAIALLSGITNYQQHKEPASREQKNGIPKLKTTKTETNFKLKSNWLHVEEATDEDKAKEKKRETKRLNYVSIRRMRKNHEEKQEKSVEKSKYCLNQRKKRNCCGECNYTHDNLYVQCECVC